MNTLTIWITVVGMGLTFAAIGLLIAAMVALTRGAAERGPKRRSSEPGSAIPTQEETEALEAAAAAAVAVAMALAARRAHPTHAWHAASPAESVSPWQAYNRSQQLEQQKTHQTLRW